MAEQLSQRDRRRRNWIRQVELGQHLDDRPVEVEQPLVDHLHGERRRPDFRDRPDLEDGVARDLDTGRLVQHPGRGRRQGVRRAVQRGPDAQDAQRSARHAVLVDELSQPVGPVPRIDGRPVRRDHASASRS
jgi:hypothetical protein